MQVLSLFKALVQANSVYYMQNGYMANNFEELAVSLADEWQEDSSFNNTGVAVTNGEWQIALVNQNTYGWAALSVVRIQGRYIGAGFWYSWQKDARYAEFSPTTIALYRTA